MLRDRRVRRYQKFLKTLRQPESSRCSCPSHLHPRPWVPPPCRTTRPHGRMDRSHQGWVTDDDEGQYSLRHLYNDARVLKEAFSKVRQGDHLSKDMRNTVKKWSKKNLPEQDDRSKRSRRREEKQPHTDHSQQAEGDDTRSPRELAREEEALRHKLRNLRELTQNNAALIEENKKLMRKIHQLRQRSKRQQEAQRGSRESMGGEQGTGSREEFVILSLKKKYEDLLHYVLKVESENQKLKSLTGMSGDHEDYFNGSDREDITCGPRVVARLEGELEALRREIMKKDDYIVDCERHMQTLKENISLQESRRNQNASAGNIDTAMLEEEWMRRLNETREMYDRAIQGYKDQLEELQAKLLSSEQRHAEQVQELVARLTKAQSEVTSARTSNETHDEAVSHQNGEPYGRQRSNKGKNGERSRSIGTESPEQDEDSDSVSSKSEETEREKGRTGAARAGDEVPGRSNDKTKETDNLKDDENGNKSEKANHANSRGKNHDKGDQAISGTPFIIAGFEKYSETLENLVKRVESLSVGGEDSVNTVSVIKDTISQCLQEWRESFQQVWRQQEDDADRLKKDYDDLKKNYDDLKKDYIDLEKGNDDLKKDNDDLQRKIRSKNKKAESLQYQYKDLEQKNIKLIHQCSQLESRMGASQITGHLDVLQSLPKTLQETEQRLLDTRELLQQALGEKQTLQDQVKIMGEKLSKKESKLKAEREQSTTREKEIANHKENILSIHHQLEEVTREVSHLREQLSTKDTILEHTSAQLEERIRECASLSSQVERYRLQQNQESDRIQTQLTERDSASHKQYVEAQTLATRYQAQLSALRSEKDHNEKSLRNHVRKLEEQIDQLQLRNSTLQRQLTTITSTYHNMFSTVDLDPLCPVPGGSNVKGP
ncbi:Outer dense fiber protein 2-like [Homarus americanus]|uniref:Outer dense fiber protein 2-like n=1 Tax=Homarus americanus TaxID=6706 RepID=A0A8J5JHL7_HOMAM|nr:Outer dense fiber protein 2-like [Homarus americanus]